MLRRLFKLQAIFSILLCVAMVMLWVRSYYLSDDITYAWPSETSGPWIMQRMFGLQSGNGRLLVRFCEQQYNGTLYDQEHWRYGHRPPPMFQQMPAGWAWYAVQDASPYPFDDFARTGPVFADLPVEFDSVRPHLRMNPGPSLTQCIWAALRFSAANYNYLGSDARHGWSFNFPMWFPLAIISLPLSNSSIRWLILRRRGKIRQRAGKCAKCGYDLRASVDRCPECGAAIAKMDATGVAWASSP